MSPCAVQSMPALTILLCVIQFLSLSVATNTCTMPAYVDYYISSATGLVAGSSVPVGLVPLTNVANTNYQPTVRFTCPHSVHIFFLQSAGHIDQLVQITFDSDCA